MRRLAWISGLAAVCLAGLVGCGGGNPPEPVAGPTAPPATGTPSPGAPAAGVPVAAASPMEEPYVPAADPLRKPDANAAETLRHFLMAMVERNQAVLQQVTLNHPELPVLWQGEKPPADYLADARQEIAAITFYRVLPGDTVLGLDGKEMLIKETDIQSHQLLLTFDENPIPFFLEQQQGVWKVHAAPIIATRKIAAAEAALEAQENATAGQPPSQPGVQPAEQLGTRPGETAVPPGGTPGTAPGTLR